MNSGHTIFVGTDHQCRHVHRQGTGVRPFMKQLPVNPYGFFTAIFDKNVVMPLIKGFPGPSADVIGIGSDPLRIAITTTRSIPVNMPVAPRHMGKEATAMG